MIIAIDCRMLNASGIGAYIRGVLPFILQSNNDFLLIGKKDELQLFSGHNNTRIIECDIKPFSIKEIIFFPPKILKHVNKADLFFTPYFNIPSNLKIPVYTVIHDVIFADLPEITSKIGHKLRISFYKRAYRKSTKIFTVSEFSKSRIEYHFGTDKPVIVTHSAIQQIFLDYKECKKEQIKKNTIIFIGNIKKHKGLACLLEAFILLKEHKLNYKLLIIGNKDSFRSADYSTIEKINSLSDDSISFSGYISDTQLMEYIAESKLLVQPSLYEGFCLPPLEAMVLGTKALISDIPVLKEIYSQYPVTLFNAGDSIDLKNKILEILKKNESSFYLPDELSLKYTFQKTASILLNNFN